MKITGDSNDINEIMLNLNSTNVRFRCFVDALPYCNGKDLAESNAAIITFNDSREIDLLITMLEKFKEQNIGYIGRWEQGVLSV